MWSSRKYGIVWVVLFSSNYCLAGGVGCRAAFAGKPAPTVDRVQPREMGWLSGRLRQQAGPHSGLSTSASGWGGQGRFRWQASSYSRSGTAARDGLAFGPPSPAGWLPQWIEYIRERLVGYKAAIASQPAPTGGNAYGSRSGRPVGRLAFALAFDFLAPSRGRSEYQPDLRLQGSPAT
jgi:hypothetical protein